MAKEDNYSNNYAHSLSKKWDYYLAVWAENVKFEIDFQLLIALLTADVMWLQLPDLQSVTYEHSEA